MAKKNISSLPRVVDYGPSESPDNDYGIDNPAHINSPLYVEYKGERVALAALIRRLYPGFSLQQVKNMKARITRLGWNVEDAVTLPFSKLGDRHPNVLRVKPPRRLFDEEADGLRKRKLLALYYNYRSFFNNPNSRCYKNYGALGLSFGPEWATDAYAFMEWGRANGYVSGLRLTRIDKSLPYGPSNCRWITQAEHKGDQSDAQYVQYKGKGVFLAELIERFHPDPNMRLVKQIKRRINMLGWDVETAITTPFHPAGLHILPESEQSSLYGIDKSAIDWLL